MNRRFPVAILLLVLGTILQPLPSPADASGTYLMIDDLAVDPLLPDPHSSTRFVADEFRMDLGTPPPNTATPEKDPPAGINFDPDSTEMEPAMEWDHLLAAQRLARQLDWSGAKREIEFALALRPDRNDLLQRAALYASMAGQYAVADLYYGRYLKQYPDDIESRAAWSGVLLRLREFERSAIQADQVLVQSPFNQRALFHRSLVGLITGEGTLPMRPDSTSLQEQLQLSIWLSGGREDLQGVLDTAQLDEAVRRLLGIKTGLEGLDDVRRTLQSLSSTLNAEDFQAARPLIDTLREAGLRGLSLDMAEARIHYLEGDRATALEQLEDLTRRYPRQPTVWYNTGLIALKSGAYDRADSAFTRALELEPEAPTARFGLAAASIQLNRADRGWELLQGLAEDQPAALVQFLQGNAPYLLGIREDSRFPDFTRMLQQRLGAPLPSF